jgi:hypothetical protein
MNEKKKNRRDLRNRLQRAQIIILRRKGWPLGSARKMAREYADKICAEIKKKNDRP